MVMSSRGHELFYLFIYLLFYENLWREKYDGDVIY